MDEDTINLRKYILNGILLTNVKYGDWFNIYLFSKKDAKGFIEQKKVIVRKGDDLSSEELHLKIFNEKNLKNKTFELHFTNLLKEIDIDLLKEMIKKFFPLLSIKGEEKPLNKRNIIEWIKHKAFGLQSNTAKRAIEKQYLQEKEEERFLQVFNQQYFPIELLKIIVSFLPKNKELLNGLGLVNEEYYLFCLSSWRKIDVLPTNVNSIPLVVLKNSTVVNIPIKLYTEDYRYLLESLKNVQVIRCNSLKLIEAMKQKPLIILNIEELDIFQVTDTKYSRRRVKYLNQKYFPKLKRLAIKQLHDEFPYDRKWKHKDCYGKISLRNISMFTTNYLTKFIRNAVNLKELKMRPIDFLHPDDFYKVAPDTEKEKLRMKKDSSLQHIEKLQYLQSLEVTLGFLEYFKAHICSITSLENIKIIYLKEYGGVVDPIHFSNCKRLENLKNFHFFFEHNKRKNSKHQLFKKSLFSDVDLVLRHLTKCKKIQFVRFQQRNKIYNFRKVLMIERDSIDGFNIQLGAKNVFLTKI